MCISIGCWPWSIKGHTQMASNPRQITSADLFFFFSCPQNPSVNHLNFYCIKQIDNIFPVCVYCNRSQKTAQRVKNNSHAGQVTMLNHHHHVLLTVRVYWLQPSTTGQVIPSPIKSPEKWITLQKKRFLTQRQKNTASISIATLINFSKFFFKPLFKYWLIHSVWCPLHLVSIGTLPVWHSPIFLDCKGKRIHHLVSSDSLTNDWRVERNWLTRRKIWRTKVHLRM